MALAELESVRGMQVHVKWGKGGVCANAILECVKGERKKGVGRRERE